MRWNAPLNVAIIRDTGPSFNCTDAQICSVDNLVECRSRMMPTHHDAFWDHIRKRSIYWQRIMSLVGFILTIPRLVPG